MGLNTSGSLLEGVRLASSSNAYAYPPRNFVSNATVFSSLGRRAEYCLLVSGQDLSSTSSGIELGDPNLSFLWVRNDYVFRFDYDSFSRRWFPAPGASPAKLGVISNSPRLTAPIPRPEAYSDSSYQIYLGLPRIASFSVVVVNDSGSFGNPSAGTVEISSITGELNFGLDDLSNPNYVGSQVFVSRQNFFDRQRSNGSIGKLPTAGGYDIFLNPIPTTGQIPLLKIGFRKYLTVSEYPFESSMPVPASGHANFALDTGRVLLGDASSFPGETVYYDGVVMGKISPTHNNIGTITPGSGPVLVGTVPSMVGNVDPTRYVFYVNNSPRYYLLTSIVDSAPSSVDYGYAFIVKSTGEIYISPSDASSLAGGVLTFIDTYLPVDGGVTFQVYRSGINGAGPEIVPDFVEFYKVVDQVVVDGIQGSPFVILPSKPVQDSDLSYKVVAGSGGGGTFVGSLADASNPATPGLGYLLDLEQRKLSFTNRKSTSKVLKASTPSVKLDDSAIVPLGFSTTIDGVPVTSGVDFDFNPDAGTVDFLEPIGESDPGDFYGILGEIVLPSTFTSQHSFVPGDVGSYLFVHSGPNAGFRKILQLVNPHTVTVSRDFVQSGSQSLDIRKTFETIADRFWTNLSPPMKKFVLEIAPSVSGPFVPVPESEFQVIPQVGQINLVNMSNPGSVFRATYVSLDSNDEGVTVTETNRVEILPSKVRLDPATYVTGSNIIKFNQSGKTILPDAGITVTVDGVRLDPSNVQFISPDSAVIGVTLKSEEVFVDYSIAESVGGSKTLNLSNVPVVADYPTFTSGSREATFNGDQSTYLKPGAAVQVDGKDTYIVESSSYDSTTDSTSTTFTTQIVNDFVGSFLVCDVLTFEMASGPSDQVPSGTNSLFIVGSPKIFPGTVITLDGDPYSVISSSFKFETGKTAIVLATSAQRNYIIFDVLFSTSPVFSPGSSFFTSRPADVRSPFTLFKDGASPRTLSSESDYVVSDGGQINLTSSVGYGDSILATYVARVPKPVGTSFSFNYAHAISPGDSNGLAGQKLLSTYNLYSPDSFFYRIETVETYIPEVSDAIKQGASQTPSGPTTSAPANLKNKDYGIPSLFFDEQKLSNLDYVTQILLKYYNDLINQYEDLLSDLDGRVVGGLSGRFRYDGSLTNSPRSTYYQVTNDVDDRVKLYDLIELTGFFTFSEVPVYSSMWQSNSLSRIFPTVRQVNVALNDKTGVADMGSIIGNLGVSSITSLSTVTLAPAVSRFKSSLAGAQLEIQSNGDPKKLIPQFTAGQKLNVYNDSGVSIGTTTISSVSGTGPYTLAVSPSVSVIRGGVSVDTSDPGISSNKFYFPGTDLAFDSETGNLLNVSYQFLISMNFQRPVSGSSIVTATVSYQNSDTAPKRIPVLDGSELSDSGFSSVPPLHRRSEVEIIQDEFDILSGPVIYGSGSVLPDLITVSGLSLPPLLVGDTIRFLGGPNAGESRTVSLVSSPSLVVVSSSFPSASATEYGLEKVNSPVGDYSSILQELIGILNDNSASPPISPSLIGKVDSELKSLSSICNNIGKIVGAGSGTVAGSTITDLTASFPVPKNSYLFVPDGNNAGLYKVVASTATSLTISSDLPFQVFPSTGTTNYVLMELYSFLTSAGPNFLTEAFRKTKAFYDSTVIWDSSITVAGSPARLASVTQRISDISDTITKAEQVLKTGDSLYSRRYMWIQQRTDKKDGFLTKRNTAELSRLDSTTKLIQNQQKILALSGMTG